MEKTYNRVPPQNIEAEQSVLGAMLVDSAAVAKAVELLKTRDFYRDSHRFIFAAMLELEEKTQPVDLITVAENLKKAGNLEKAGGLSYLTSLSGVVPTTANVEQYCKIVEEKAILRNLISASNEIIEESYKAESIEEILDIAERKIFDISQKRGTTSYHHIKEVVEETYKNIESAFRNKGKVTGLPTGYVEFDKITAGLQRTDLIILAARPSMGKSALSLNISANLALRSKKNIAFFSVEMGRHSLAQRMICSEAGIDAQRVRTGYLEDRDWSKLLEGVAKLSSTNIYIDDTPGIPIMELRSKARRLKAEHDIDLIIIDYLQLITTTGRRTESRQQEIAYITRQLKALARELDIPIIALAQLSRAVEQRQDKRPILSDLRESGEIEQTADVVAFIHREDYYNPETENQNVTEIIIRKHRNGPTGTIKLLFFKNIGRFVNMEVRHEEGA